MSKEFLDAFADLRKEKNLSEEEVKELIEMVKPTGPTLNPSQGRGDAEDIL